MKKITALLLGLVVAHYSYASIPGTDRLISRMSINTYPGTVIHLGRCNGVLPKVNDYSAYLFVYFTGNTGDQEAIRLALSNDAYNYRSLNNNLPIIGSDTISDMKGVRDPHILRCNDGKTFYMVVTDMKADLGWSANHGMVFLKSTDLINWTWSRIDIRAAFPKFSEATKVWAPQTIYDPKVGKYMVYFSMCVPCINGGIDGIYYAYANKDFTALESTPQALFSIPNFATIDGDIINKDGLYYLFFDGGHKAISKNLTGPYVEDTTFKVPTKLAVEGSCIFKMINSDNYILMYDVFKNGAFDFTKGSDLINFTKIDETSVDFTPRHGTVMAITQEEASALAKKWGQRKDMVIHTADAKSILRNDVIINETSGSVYLPVKKGTKLKSFDPHLKSMPGITITPSGPQDFTKGVITYKLTLRNWTKAYTVTTQIKLLPAISRKI